MGLKKVKIKGANAQLRILSKTGGRRVLQSSFVAGAQNGEERMVEAMDRWW